MYNLGSGTSGTSAVVLGYSLLCRVEYITASQIPGQKLSEIWVKTVITPLCVGMAVHFLEPHCSRFVYRLVRGTITGVEMGTCAVALIGIVLGMHRIEQLGQ